MIPLLDMIPGACLKFPKDKFGLAGAILTSEMIHGGKRGRLGAHGEGMGAKLKAWGGGVPCLKVPGLKVSGENTANYNIRSAYIQNLCRNTLLWNSLTELMNLC